MSNLKKILKYITLCRNLGIRQEKKNIGMYILMSHERILQIVLRSVKNNFLWYKTTF